ncbi:hypothetical protein [Kaarinaea lacus]
MMALIFIGCDNNDSSNNHAKNSTLAPFQKPADGKLTEQHVADYIVIRQKIITDVKAQKLAKQMTMSEYEAVRNPDKDTDIKFRHFDEIEKAAAASFKKSYEEFLWIKDSIITAQTKMLVRRYYELNNKIMSLLDQTLTRYKEINAEESQQQEQQIMNGYVAEIKQELTNLRDKTTDADDGSEALEHNIIIVTKFKKELDTLQQQALQPLVP